MTLTSSRLIFPDAPPGIHTGYCSICGEFDNTHFTRNELLTPTSANLTAIFDFKHDHVCRFCSAIWREPKKYHRAILATPESVIFPVISRDSVTDDRPVWSDMIRSLSPDLPRVIILTTDPKKRVWPFARISQGKTACVMVHDPSRGISGNSWVILDQLISALDLIESVYESGFSKPMIAESLYSGFKQSQTVGMAKTASMEKRIAAIRNTPEFIPALIMAQKTERI